MSVLKINGATLTDTVFTLDLPTFPEITWNVTRLTDDAKRGRFGQPVTLPLSEIPRIEPGSRGNLDWDKVQQIMRLPVIEIPIMVVLLRRHSVIYSIIVDGNHRTAARQELGLATITRYEVPPELEGAYRVQIEGF